MILIEYPDYSSRYTREDFHDMMNEENYKAWGSMRDYFLQASRGALDLDIEVFGWYKASKPYTYYANKNGSLVARELAAEAVDAANRAGVDFSRYDNNKDGYADAVMVAHSGPGAESGGRDRYIWSHKWALFGEDARAYDGVRIYQYSMQAETRWWGMVGIGIFCHEFGHLLGLPDLYDIDPNNGNSEGIGNYGLMGGGSWLNHEQTPANFCAWSRRKLGWINTQTINKGTISIPPAVNSNTVLFKVPTSNPREYFLLENRQNTGQDKYLPAHGLAIWHIDESTSNNADENRKMVDLEEADGLDELDKDYNRGNRGDLYPGTTNNTVFSQTSYPNSNLNTGERTEIIFQSISETNNTIQLSINEPGAYDPCANSITIDNCGSANSMTTEGGHAGAWFTESTNSCGYLTPGKEQIYRFTPKVSGVYSITVTSAKGYMDYLWKSGDCSASDWNCIGFISSPGKYGRMTWKAGETYYILLDDEDNSTGNHSFYISCPNSQSDVWVNLNTDKVVLASEANASAKISIESNTNWYVKSNSAWISVLPLSGSKNGSFTIKALSNNTSDEQRFGSVSVTANGIAPLTVDVSQTSETSPPPPDGKNLTVCEGEEIPPLTVEGTLVRWYSTNAGHSFTDERDGQVYKTLNIGSQTWMAENLNYGVWRNNERDVSDNGIVEKYCANNDEEQCGVYGGLYTWDELMGYSTTESDPGICPEGWHVPANGEWKALELSLGMSQEEADLLALWRGTDQGTQLKAGGSSGFDVIMAGKRKPDGTAVIAGEYATFWTSTQLYNRTFFTREKGIFSSIYDNRENGFSLRCVKNNSDYLGSGNTWEPDISEPGTYTFYATQTLNGVESEKTALTVTILPAARPDLGGPYALNNVNSVTLDAGGGYDSYKWSTGALSRTITVNQPGVYSVTVKNAGGCSGTSFAEVTMSLDAPIAEDVSVCEGDMNTILSATGTNLRWYSSNEDGVLLDNRDGKSYKTVNINGQIWMAENLNYGTRISNDISAGDNDVAEKYCANNSEDQCSVYGALYSWDELMDYSEEEGSRGICPEGWHVPSHEEWKRLETNLGMSDPDANAIAQWRGTDQGSQLKTGGSSGFNALMGGKRKPDGTTAAVGTWASFWTSTYIYNRTLWTDSQGIFASIYDDKENGFSVRCIKNSSAYLASGSNFDPERTEPGIYTYYVSQTVNSVESDKTEVRLIIHEKPELQLTEKLEICEGDSIRIDGGTGFTEYNWSTGENTQSVYLKKEGRYFLTVSNQFNCKNRDSVTVVFYPLPAIYIQGDETPCFGRETVLVGGDGFSSYLWEDGSKEPIRIVTESGNYILTAMDEHACSAIDSISVEYEPELQIAISGPTDACKGDTIVLDAGEGYAEYKWNTGSTNPALFVNESGIYEVEVRNEDGCTGSGEHNIDFLPVTVINIKDLYQSCDGETLTLDAGSGYVSYNWSTGENGRYIDVEESGEIEIEVRGVNQCSNSKLIRIEFLPLPEVSLGPDTSIRANEKLFLSPGSEYSSWLWNTGAVNSGIYVQKDSPGDYLYYVEVSNNFGCSNSDSVIVSVTLPGVGISENASTGQLNLYPNPAKDKIILESGDITETKVQVRVFRLDGKVLHSEEIPASGLPFKCAIDVSLLPAGNYFISVEGLETRFFLNFSRIE